MADIRTYYLIDYENVGIKGLGDIATLPGDVQAHLFSTRKSEKIPTKVLSQMMEKNIVVHEVPEGSQSVDKHLVSYLGYLIGLRGSAAEYIIVSKDTGYDNLVHFWKAEQGVRLRRERARTVERQKSPEKKNAPAQTAVKSGSKESKREHQVRCFFGQTFKEEKYRTGREAIIEAVLAGKTKVQVNMLLNKSFPSSEVKVIYGRLKPLIAALPGQ